MRLRDLALFVTEIEGTTSRRTLVERVAGLLGRARPAEIPAVVALLQGALAPPHEGIEIGLGEKLLVTSLARAHRRSRETVARMMARKGDLGLVAESLGAGSAPRTLGIEQAYRSLRSIAETGGAGSLERKTASMAALLEAVSGAEAKILVRVAAGRLRLGIGDQTILEAAALAAFGDRSTKPLLEHAYNVRSDLGLVVALAFARGRKALVGIGPEVGTPVRPALAQRLASAEEIVSRLGRVQVEPKYDGLRLQLHKAGKRAWIFTRRLENVTDSFPELGLALIRQLRPARAIIEGEAVAYDPATGEFLPFQVTITRKRKSGVEAAALRHPLRLFAFDLLSTGRKSWLDTPQRDRTAALRRQIATRVDAPIVPTEAIVTKDPDAVQACFDEMITRGLEGIVAKKLDAPYRAGSRGYDWVKLKRAYQASLRDTVDLVLVGYLRGRGRRTALGIGSLLGAVYDRKKDRFRTVAKIGSGLSEPGWKEIRAALDDTAVRQKPARVDALIEPDVWVEPSIVVEVLADEITRSPAHTCGKVGDEPGYALRFPRITRGIRTDKGPTEATTEREILDLYRLQRKTPARKT